MCRGKVINFPKESPFEYLKRSDGTAFDEQTIRNWYIAREYVLNKFGEVEIGPDCEKHLRVVITDNWEDEKDDKDGMMLAVLRQVALTAHFANFVEYDKFDNRVCYNRTIITFISKRKDLLGNLKDEGCLWKLMDYCSYSYKGDRTQHEELCLDIELEIVENLSATKGNNEEWIEMSRDEVCSFENKGNLRKIDTRKAVYTSRMYDLGAEIGNLPAEDIHNAHRYQQALDKFQYVKMKDPGKKDPVKKLVNDAKWTKEQCSVKEGLSNLFCADCFELRQRGIKQSWKKEKENKENGEGNDKLNKLDDMWEYHNEALSRSEHARWMVEKLILGYRPMNDKERSVYESYCGKKRKDYVKKLKKRDVNPVHIDLCSYHNLRRIDPDNMKYDSFLMLAIPKILEKIGKHDK